MMRFDPSLRVVRFRVERRGTAAYDEHFHLGVNIVRGANSSGKSTVLNLLFYALGGELRDWSETALLCDRVLVEVLLSGKTVTLERDIAEGRSRPMQIFSGSMDDALEAKPHLWLRHPYARSDSTASFSEILFGLLGFPEVTTEARANITMNQVLRLLYADQLSPVDTIFKAEPFDPPALRDAVGRMLCGAFDSEVYTNGLRIRELDKEYEQIVGELRSFYRILGKADQIPSEGLFGAQQAELLRDRAQLLAEIHTLEGEMVAAAQPQILSLAAQRTAYDTLQQLQGRLADAVSRRDALSLEVKDSSDFMAELQRKREALDDAEAVTHEIDHVRFHFCPSCFAPMEEVGPHACRLCKTPFDAEKGKLRVVAMIGDIEIQLKQSRLLQKTRLSELVRIDALIEDLTAGWQAASRQFTEAQQSPSSELRQQVNAAQRQLGYIDRQIEDLQEKLRIAEIVSGLNTKKQELASSIAKLKERNDSLERDQEQRLANAFSRVSDEVRKLLVDDVSRQDSFENPETIRFDFVANRISVDQHTYFSASSRVVLRNSFFVGFLTAAANVRSFRHPRFLMMDSIEDKGMEPERAHNFQRLIVRNVELAASECQVIFGTSMIAPDLEDPAYTVGRRSTQQHRTLAIGG